MPVAAVTFRTISSIAAVGCKNGAAPTAAMLWQLDRWFPRGPFSLGGIEASLRPQTSRALDTLHHYPSCGAQIEEQDARVYR